MLVWKSYGDTGRTALGKHGCWRVFTDGKWWHLTHQAWSDPLTLPRGKFVDRQRAMDFAQEREDGVEVVPLTDQPINVWHSDGVRYEDYRQPDGRITTVRAGK